MKADISRDIFQATRDVRRVVTQQGRPWLDADWNEQVAVLLHRLETMAADIFGEYAAIGEGFHIEKVITANPKGEQKFAFLLNRGRYYLHGLMCENDEAHVYEDLNNLGTDPHVVYLHAWEQYASALEDPAAAEPALQRVDTCGRTTVRWSVQYGKNKDGSDWNTFRRKLGVETPAVKLKLRARENTRQDSERSQGRPLNRVLENVLYRVEVHSVTNGTVCLKWARNNASALTRVSRQGSSLNCHGAGDLDAGFQPNAWVELEVPDGSGREFRRIASMNRESGTIELAADAPKDPCPASTGENVPSTAENLLARPWAAVAPAKEKGWQPLDAGLEFELDFGAGRTRQARPGQYWLIAVRTNGTGQVYWPRKHTPTESGSKAIEYEWGPIDGGIDDNIGVAPQESDLSTHKSPFDDQEGRAYRRRHYYGPLALIQFDHGGTLIKFDDLRKPRGTT